MQVTACAAASHHCKHAHAMDNRPFNPWSRRGGARTFTLTRETDMNRRTWTLTDIDFDIFSGDIVITPDDLDAGAPYRVSKRTLRGGLRDGLDVVEVDNG